MLMYYLYAAFFSLNSYYMPHSPSFFQSSYSGYLIQKSQTAHLLGTHVVRVQFQPEAVCKIFNCKLIFLLYDNSCNREAGCGA